jgi:hypothetical protein
MIGMRVKFRDCFKDQTLRPNLKRVKFRVPDFVTKFGF